MKSLSHANLKAYKGSMFEVALTSTKQNPKHFDNNDQKVLELLFHCVVERYLNTGCGQYLRDFRRDYNIQKTEAHRKRVVERKATKEKKDEKVKMESITSDRSQNKEYLHRFLLALVSKRPTVFNTTLYSKSEIKILFQAYGMS